MSKKKFLVIVIIILSLIFLSLALWGKKSIKNTKIIIDEHQIATSQIENLKIKNSTINERLEEIENIDNDIGKTNAEQDTKGFQLMKDFNNITKLIIALGISLSFSIILMIILFVKNRTSTIADNNNTDKFDFLEAEENVKLFYDKKIVDLNTEIGIKKIINSLTEGNIVIIPCDTVYGICGVVSEKTRHTLIDIKNRDDKKNTFIILATLSQAHKLIGRNLNKKLYSLWPAPISFITFKKNKDVTICVRVPDDEILQRILAKTGPIYSTSVNMSGEPSLNNVYEICIKFGDKVNLIAKNDNKEFTLSSTIIDATKKTLRVVRQGSFPIDKLKDIANIEENN